MQYLISLNFCWLDMFFRLFQFVLLTREHHYYDNELLKTDNNGRHAFVWIRQMIEARHLYVGFSNRHLLDRRKQSSDYERLRDTGSFKNWMWQMLANHVIWHDDLRLAFRSPKVIWVLPTTLSSSTLLEYNYNSKIRSNRIHVYINFFIVSVSCSLLKWVSHVTRYTLYIIYTFYLIIISLGYVVLVYRLLINVFEES